MTLSKLFLPLSFVCALTAAQASDHSNLLDLNNPMGINAEAAKAEVDRLTPTMQTSALQKEVAYLIKRILDLKKDDEIRKGKHATSTKLIAERIVKIAALQEKIDALLAKNTESQVLVDNFRKFHDKAKETLQAKVDALVAKVGTNLTPAQVTEL